MRIAFDIDGVVADMESELARQAEILFGEPAARPGDPTAVAEAANQTGVATEGSDGDEPPIRSIKLSARQQRRLWAHVETVNDFWRTLKETEPGIVKRLAAIATERRWEVMFLTKRPQTVGETSQLQTQRWLMSHGFDLPSVYVVQGSRGRIAASLDLDIVVDDRPENCLDVVVDSKARAILVWREDQNLLPAAARRLGIGVVKSVGECLDILTQIEPGDREPSRMMDRVRRLLGLKSEPAQA